MSLTQEHLFERLNYDPESGIFYWNPRNIRSDYKRFDLTWNSRYAGLQAGAIHKIKNSKLCYLRINIDGKNYPAHRLAFLYMTGQFPANGIDHNYGNGINNRWRNLRLATASENCANSHLRIDNTSGFKGVSFHKRKNRYRSSIRVHGKDKHLGYFDIPEIAHAAYVTAANKYFGEFSRLD